MGMDKEPYANSPPAKTIFELSCDRDEGGCAR